MVIYHAIGVRHIRWNISRSPSYGLIGVGTHITTKNRSFWALFGVPESDIHSPNLPMVIYHATGVRHIRWNISRNLKPLQCLIPGLFGPVGSGGYETLSGPFMNQKLWFFAWMPHFHPNEWQSTLEPVENFLDPWYTHFWPILGHFRGPRGWLSLTKPPNGHISCQWGQTHPLEHFQESIIWVHRG